MLDKYCLIDIIPVTNILGESVTWNAQDQSIWWTDIEDKKLYKYQLYIKKLSYWSLLERLTSFGFTIKPKWLICTFASGFALYNPYSKVIK